MYLAGIMDHFSAAPKMELIVWGSTVGKLVFGLSGVRDQLKRARSVAGGIKPGSTGPSIWTNLALLGQLCGFILPQFVFVTAIAYNKFHQPEWMTEHALPSPPDVLGIDGVVIGRTVGLLVLHAVASLTQTALRALGDQYHAIGIREKPRLIDSGLFAYVRHPLYAYASYSPLLNRAPYDPIRSGALLVEVAQALVFWSYIPLYILPIGIGGCLLKMPIEERTMIEDPVLGNEYKLYKMRVPYRLIPYIW